MRLGRRPEEDEAEEAFAEPAPAPMTGGYRVAGGLEVRTMELEQELGQAKDRIRKMQREVYAARRVVARRKLATALSRGGNGSTIMAVVAAVLYGLDVTSSPTILLGLVFLGFGFGALAGMRWEKEDDFPAPPAPRID